MISEGGQNEDRDPIVHAGDVPSAKSGFSGSAQAVDDIGQAWPAGRFGIFSAVNTEIPP